MFTSKKTLMAAIVGAAFVLSACSAERAVDNTVDATGFVVKTATKSAIGAGKFVVKGTKKAVGADD